MSKCIHCAHIKLEGLQAGERAQIEANSGWAFCKAKQERGMTLGYERQCESFEMASGEKLISRKAWIDNREVLANKTVSSLVRKV